MNAKGLRWSKGGIKRECRAKPVGALRPFPL